MAFGSGAGAEQAADGAAALNIGRHQLQERLQAGLIGIAAAVLDQVIK